MLRTLMQMESQVKDVQMHLHSDILTAANNVSKYPQKTISICNELVQIWSMMLSWIAQCSSTLMTRKTHHETLGLGQNIYMYNTERKYHCH